jgi:hypothetical protein
VLGCGMSGIAADAGVAAEVVTNIYYHLKQASPLANTILVSGG